LILVLGSFELYCRLVLGLGDPPLYRSDSSIGYVLQPSRTYRRFHRRFSVNAYSMRSDDFPPQKSAPDELRVLVVGDSVVWGAIRIDQSDLDTAILKRRLQQQCRCPIVIGNVATPGWGPPNELAYLERYGIFDADVVVLELSSSDYADAPGAASDRIGSREFPEKKPVLALADFYATYFVPRILHHGAPEEPIDYQPGTSAPAPSAIAKCAEAERQIFRLARAHHAKVALLQHLSVPELKGKYQAGYYANQAIAREEKVPFVDDAEELRAQMESGQNPFYSGDPIHLNWTGQKVLASILQRALEVAQQSQ
jgi:hypothetical protein